MAINVNYMRDCLRQFDFQRLFVEELGWSQPSNRQTVSFTVKDNQFFRRQVAQLAGVVVFEVTAEEGRIPDAQTRATVHREIAKHHHENLLIFLDQDHMQSLWYWVKRQDGKTFPREHLYVQGQPGDLFVSKLGQMVFDISEFDEAGNVNLVDVARRMRAAPDIERVTKKFYGDFQNQHMVFLELIQGVPDERQRRWYASVLLNRLMFIYFLQKKGFLDSGDINYLQNKLAQSKQQAENRFFSSFLKPLFFEGFAKPAEKRSPEARQALGAIKYLNGGLFLPHKVEQGNPKLDVPDKAFENLLNLFDRYSWNLDDTPGGKDDEINPDVLGYIFEKYINQKEFGAYYTRTEITEYLCERTIHQLILDAVNTPASVRKHLPAGMKARQYDTLGDLLMDLDAPLCKQLLHEVLPRLSLLDPACGSGAFLVAAMKTLINVYAAVIGKIKFLGDRSLSQWLAKTEREHPSISYFIKKSIITDNLYGVDIMEEATEIARLRLFLALVAAAEHVDQLEPLPNIDFNILPGNSLIGLMRVDDEAFEKRTSQQELFRKSYRQVLEEKNRLVDNYRHAATYAEDLTVLRDNIEAKKRQAIATLDDILLDEFKNLGIKFEQATWDDKKEQAGKSIKRLLKLDDIERLHPFHWGFEFDEILNKRGGFDAIITNPPWEIFKPIDKEFCYDLDPSIERRGTDIKTFQKKLSGLLADPKVRKRYLEYLSDFPHVSAFFRAAPQYKNQIAILNGKKAGTDINLYKLFTEQSFNLLRHGGLCGLVVPSGIYSDLGTKQLRTMLFEQSTVTGLFCFENRKGIFEGVDSRFKFVVLTFQKGNETHDFPAAFMRLDVGELENFPRQGGINIPINLARRLSPDTLSVVEFRNEIDVCIAEKSLQFPLLGQKISNKWELVLGNEFHMTNDSYLFETSPAMGRLPLYEGKMIWHFDHKYNKVRYWVDGKRGRAAILGRELDIGQVLDYQQYRFAYRSITGNTNERTTVCSIIPKYVFFGHSLNASKRNGVRINDAEIVVLTALMSSFVVDYFLRLRVATQLTMFYVYQIPVPRLTEYDPEFSPIVTRAARLICTTPEFDDLAKEVGLHSHEDGVTNPTERAQLRAELDGLIAHLYGLTEEEFVYVLSTFPLVPDPVKVATHNAYRDVDRGIIRSFPVRVAFRAITPTVTLSES